MLSGIVVAITSGAAQIGNISFISAIEVRFERYDC